MIKNDKINFIFKTNSKIALNFLIALFVISAGFLVLPIEETRAGSDLAKPVEIEELKIKQIQADKYAFKSLAEDLTEIGEEKHSPAQPYLKLNKWDGEVSLKVDIPYAKNEVKTLAENKLKWKNHK